MNQPDYSDQTPGQSPFPIELYIPVSSFQAEVLLRNPLAALARISNDSTAALPGELRLKDGEIIAYLERNAAIAAGRAQYTDGFALLCLGFEAVWRGWTVVAGESRLREVTVAGSQEPLSGRGINRRGLELLDTFLEAGTARLLIDLMADTAAQDATKRTAGKQAGGHCDSGVGYPDYW